MKRSGSLLYDREGDREVGCCFFVFSWKSSENTVKSACFDFE